MEHLVLHIQSNNKTFPPLKCVLESVNPDGSCYGKFLEFKDDIELQSACAAGTLYTFTPGHKWAVSSILSDGQFTLRDLII